ncbi:18579_t:CDS:2, partial [Gigaspora margarita]
MIRAYNLALALSSIGAQIDKQVTGTKVAVIMIDNEEENEISTTNMIIHLKKDGLKHISHLHAAYTLLYYVLLFPYGKDE